MTTVDHNTPGYQRSVRCVYAVCSGILALLLATGLYRLVQRPALVDAAPLEASAPGIDPNTAPWYDLARLPRVGEALAKRIVTFREAAKQNGTPRPFERPDDLQTVPGIGPKTTERLQPFLRFPP